MARWLCLVLLALAVGAWADTPFSFMDDFSRYPAGSDGAPVWETSGIDWATGTKCFTNTATNKDFALLAVAPHGKRVTVQATLTVRRTTGTNWKVAGVCVQQSESNYWHLALVEGPDADGKKHFVELTEMLNDVWLGQWQTGSKLTTRAQTGTDFDWQYNHPYRLTLELAPDSITGIIFDGEKQCAKISYAFDAPAVTSGKPGLDSAGFAAEFTAFTTRVTDPVAAPLEKPTFPPYPHADEGPGFFTVRHTATGLTFIDPADKPFFALGVDHVNYNAHWCEKLGYAPYHRNVEKQYGSEAKWADATVARLTAWKFTALGVGASPGVRHRGLPHQELLGLGTGFADYDAITKKTTWTGFPNVFNPKFRVYCEKQAQRKCAPLANDPWLIGYFIDNELEWHAWTGKGLWADTFAKPATDPAKQALVQLLRERHPNIADFNKAWGTTFASYEELAASTMAPTPARPSARYDESEWIRHVAETYFAVTTAAIRKADPNHLILGCRFAGQAPDIWDIAGKYCDVVSVNCYRNINLKTGAFTDGFPQQLQEWYDKARKPLMITEWSFPALDAGLPCKHGAGQRVPTQQDRAFAFTAFQKFLLTTPYVVGSNFFMWADEPALGISAVFPEDSNYGLVNEQDTPYPVLTEAATKINAVAGQLHSGKGTDFKVAAVTPTWASPTIRIANGGGGKGDCTVNVWHNGELMIQKPLTLDGKSSVLFTDLTNLYQLPGAHFCVLHVNPVNPLLDMSTTRNTKTMAYYTGMANPAVPKPRLPVIVGNPTSLPVEDAIVMVRVSAFPADSTSEKLKFIEHTAVDETGKPVPCEVFDNGYDRFIQLRVGTLPPYDSRLCYVNTQDGVTIPRHACSATTVNGVTRIDNGTLELTRMEKSAGAFDSITCNGVEMGRIYTLLWQYTDKNEWVTPNQVQKVTLVNGPVHTIMDISTAYAVPAGMPEPRPRSFSVTTRYTIDPRRPWIACRVMSVENTDTQPLEIKGYYHYALSNIAGDAKDDETHDTYWSDSAAKLNFGVWSDSRLFTTHFYKDQGGTEHPDALRALVQTIKPGERITLNEPTLYLLATPTDAWDATLARLQADLQVQGWAFPEEK